MPVKCGLRPGGQCQGLFGRRNSPGVDALGGQQAGDPARGRLGVRLLQRTTRAIHLTEEGEAFTTRARRIVGEIESLESSIVDGAVSSGACSA